MTALAPTLRAGDPLARARASALAAVLLAGAVALVAVVLAAAPAPAAVAAVGGTLLVAGRAVAAHAGGARRLARLVDLPAYGLVALAGPAAALPLAYAAVVHRSLRPAPAGRAAGGAALAAAAVAAGLGLRTDPAAAVAVLPHAAGLAAAAVAAARLARLLRDHARLLAAHEELALVCTVTGLPNGRALAGLLAADVARARRRDEPLGMLVVAPAREGGAASVDAARALAAAVRTGDWVAHLGAGRLAVVAPDAGPRELAALGERVRRRLGAGVAVGGAVLAPDDAGAGALQAAAEDALVRADEAGTVVVRGARALSLAA